jgi:RNA polymerase sigma factor (TIGR02999 family)
MDGAGASPPSQEITTILRQLARGDRGAFDRLYPLVYDELRRLAASQMRSERPGHTLQPTAVVNEAYLRLAGDLDVDWQDRHHFVAVAARAMRRVLIDYARRKNAEKRGSGHGPVTLAGDLVGRDMPLDELITLDTALDRLGEMDSRLRDVVELRFFGGLTEEETAELLGVGPRTVRRDWAKARAWLHAELYDPT